MSTRKGSAKPGPSKVYVRMLEGKITSKTYAKTIARSAGVKPKPKTA
jgi:hypothetical protein